MCVEVGYVLHKVTFCGSQIYIFNAVDVLLNQYPARHNQKSYVCVPLFKTPWGRFSVKQENLWEGEHFHNKEKACEGEYPQSLWSVTTRIANARSSSWLIKHHAMLITTGHPRVRLTAPGRWACWTQRTPEVSRRPYTSTVAT